MTTKLDLTTPLDWSGPAWDGEAVDITSANFVVTKATYARKLWVGGAGTVILILAGGSTLTFAGVPAGTMLNVAFGTVVRASTTATLMVALV